MAEKEGTSGGESIEFHQVIEDAIDEWVLDRYITKQIPKSRSLNELAEVLDVQDRQLRRYYYGETPISADKLITLCNHIKIYTPIKHILQVMEPSCLDDPSPATVMASLFQEVETFMAQVEKIVERYEETPTYRD